MFRYITSDCDAVATVYEYQKYSKTAEDAVADVLKAGPFFYACFHLLPLLFKFFFLILVLSCILVSTKVKITFLFIWISIVAFLSFFIYLI